MLMSLTQNQVNAPVEKQLQFQNKKEWKESQG